MKYCLRAIGSNKWFEIDVDNMIDLVRAAIDVYDISFGIKKNKKPAKKERINNEHTCKCR